ncbi:Zinc finger domain-containing protein, CCHC-type [Ophiocordyceps camponoti-floridani]|uniref:Zinc finger domain-containing protein, CCHC-type n=1 Tax=Ophiocordyceps camponoti-floridani TaxID=2030778 RepID=A0A8H4Q4W7_9HYPO|nr:Zinc finger domain-containing protein, CCHC-type [Ophiocordyceps camponoti-floridani]
MSSKLLTMGFMQRAAASASKSVPQDGKISKKRKQDHKARREQFEDARIQALIQEAVDNREATRQVALEKHASADTHWKLDDKWNMAKNQGPAEQLDIVYVGYGDIDSTRETGVVEEAPGNGRMSTKQKKNTEKQEPAHDETDNESDNFSSEGEDTHRKRKERHDGDDSDASSSQNRSRSRSRSRRAADGGKAKARDYEARRMTHRGDRMQGYANTVTPASLGQGWRVTRTFEYRHSYHVRSHRSLRTVWAKWRPRLRLGCGKYSTAVKGANATGGTRLVRAADAWGKMAR